jgi:hypothetical protein
MKLIDDLKRLKPNRKGYRIKPTIRFYVDKENYYFAFLPTVLWMPWIYRYSNSDGVVDIWWLHFHILIGKWETLSCLNCKHQNKCIESKKINWYCDNIFDNGESCSDFEAKY